jgi:hypothetical protein
MAEHGAYPTQVNDAAGEVIKLAPHALELAQNTRGCRAGRLETPPEVFVMLDDVVKAVAEQKVAFQVDKKRMSCGRAAGSRARLLLIVAAGIFAIGPTPQTCR